MAIEHEQRRPHLLPTETRTTEGYTAHNAGGGGRNQVPALPRQQHSSELLLQLKAVSEAQEQRIQDQRAVDIQSAIGIQVEFQSQEGVQLAAESLARDRSGIELMNVRQDAEHLMATVFVPEGKLAHFEKVIAEYANHAKDKNDNPRDHQKLVDAIASIRVATFDSLWTDSAEALPTDDQEEIWWEAWLPALNGPTEILADFRKVAELAGLTVSERVQHFPERMVAQVYGSKAQLLQSSLVLGMVAELRRAKTTAEFFAGLPLNEQADWLDNLLERVTPPNPGNSYVTLLDTGVNHGHPLIAPFTADADRHSIEPDWGPDDENGHGTELAGLALLGDLTSALADNGQITIPHRLESVKILRGPGDNEGKSYGVVTAEAVGRVEVTAPFRQRTYAMAVSSEDARDRGRPSSWSAEVDRLAGDYDGQGANPRLFVLCAGNIRDPDSWATYPTPLSTNSIHDPGQAWNALTVGAYSELNTISEADAPGYKAIAPVGGLSPYTTTSVTWDQDWPFKPDVVMEGGNVAIDEPMGFACPMDSLSLLTTGHEPNERLFALSWATSAATALTSGMCAQITAAYPQYWPETVRALVVHSARWTKPMLDTYTPNEVRNRETLRQLLRHCGYGVPSLSRALYCAGNSLTMVVQDELQPYYKDGSTIRTRDMHLHTLPWPTELLEELGDTPVTLRVTLSYFIEPNPGARGGIDKYAYQSHALRFAVRRPLENAAAFRVRINAQAAAHEANQPIAGDAGWLIGDRLRTRGSLLSDSWNGTAAELANRGQLAIYPTMGWWRNRPRHERYERAARYALVVSIEAPEIEQDLYASVAAQIVAPVPIEV